jgi:hypothetical protein
VNESWACEKFGRKILDNELREYISTLSSIFLQGGNQEVKMRVLVRFPPVVRATVDVERISRAEK